MLTILLDYCALSRKSYDYLMNHNLTDALFFIDVAEHQNSELDMFRNREIDRLMASVKVIENELGLSIVDSLMPEYQIINGVSDGLVKLGSVWYYFKEGKIDRDFTGLARNQFGWFYVKNGTIDYEYNGLAQNQFGTWYVTNGKIDTKISGCKKTESDILMIKNGVVDNTVNGLIKTEYGWLYFKNGTLETEFSGLLKNEYGWWYVENGEINYSYEGLAENEYGWWYVKNGTIDKTFEGYAKNKDGWWYVKDGSISKIDEEKHKAIEEIADQYAELKGAELAHFSIEKYRDGELGLKTITGSLGAWINHKIKSK